MRPWAAAVVLAFAVAFQIIALPLYRAGGIAPDFPFLALAYLGFFAPPRRVLAAAAIVACAVDVLSLDPIGTRLAGYLPALWLIGRARRTILAESAVLRIGLTLVGASIAFAIGWAFVSWREGNWPTPWFELKCSFYTALTGVGAYAALDLHRPRLGWGRDRFFL